MKKVFFIFVMLLSLVTLSAQIATKSILTPNTFGSIVSPTATAAIYKISGTVAGYEVFYAPMNSGSKQDLTVKLDSVSGNHTNVAVSLYGQKSALKGDWAQIGSTINWKGTTKDTTITVSNATYNYYQNFKILFTGTGSPAVTKITTTNLKLWLEGN